MPRPYRYPPRQKTRKATIGRIASEGNLVHSIEDAASLPSPIRKLAQELDYAPPYSRARRVCGFIADLCGFMRIYADLFGCDPLRYHLDYPDSGQKRGWQRDLKKRYDEIMGS